MYSVHYRLDTNQACVPSNYYIILAQTIALQLIGQALSLCMYVFLFA